MSKISSTFSKPMIQIRLPFQDPPKLSLTKTSKLHSNRKGIPYFLRRVLPRRLILRSLLLSKKNQSRILRFNIQKGLKNNVGKLSAPNMEEPKLSG